MNSYHSFHGDRDKNLRITCETDSFGNLPNSGDPVLTIGTVSLFLSPQQLSQVVRAIDLWLTREGRMAVREFYVFPEELRGEKPIHKGTKVTDDEARKLIRESLLATGHSREGEPDRLDYHFNCIKSGRPGFILADGSTLESRQATPKSD